MLIKFWYLYVHPFQGVLFDCEHGLILLGFLIMITDSFGKQLCQASEGPTSLEFFFIFLINTSLKLFIWYKLIISWLIVSFEEEKASCGYGKIVSWEVTERFLVHSCIFLRFSRFIFPLIGTPIVWSKPLHLLWFPAKFLASAFFSFESCSYIRPTLLVKSLWLRIKMVFIKDENPVFLT